MEKFLSLEYGVAGICVMLTILVLTNVAKFVWSLAKEKEKLSETTIKELIAAVEKSTATIKHLDDRLVSLEKAVAELPKFKTDIRRFYAAIKEVSGDRWPKIRDEILKDEFTL